MDDVSHIVKNWVNELEEVFEKHGLEYLKNDTGFLIKTNHDNEAHARNWMNTLVTSLVDIGFESLHTGRTVVDSEGLVHVEVRF